jgi:hypothetical protein
MMPNRRLEKLHLRHDEIDVGILNRSAPARDSVSNNTRSRGVTANRKGATVALAMPMRQE